MEKHIVFDGNEICYTVDGVGNSIVLLHGFTESKNIWNYFVEQLSNSFHIIAIDLPGHGKSQNNKEIVTMDYIADITNAVLEMERVTKTILVGHSMGGYAGVVFARKYVDKLNGFVLFHSHAFDDDEAAKSNRLRAINAIENNKAAFVMSFITDLFAPENQKMLESEIEQLKSEALQMKAENIIACLKGMMLRQSGIDVLESLNIPVLLIVGKQDPRTPFPKTFLQCEVLKHCELLLLESVAHMGYLEAKQKTLRTLASFADNAYHY